MTRRVVIVLLTPTRWAPPGVDAVRWRRALAEDVVDLAAGLSQVDVALAGDAELASAVAWPGSPAYGADRPLAALGMAAADGYEQAAVLAADAPDLPGLLLGKLLQPLTTRPVAAAPALDGPGLLGLASRLPVPAWLPDLDLDADGDPETLRAAAPRKALVAVTPGWRRLRGPAALAALDPALDGWDATRRLLSG